MREKMVLTIRSARPIVYERDYHAGSGEDIPDVKERKQREKCSDHDTKPLGLCSFCDERILNMGGRGAFIQDTRSVAQYISDCDPLVRSRGSCPGRVLYDKTFSCETLISNITSISDES